MRISSAFAILAALVVLTTTAPASAQGFKFEQPGDTGRDRPKTSAKQNRIAWELSTPCRADLKGKKIMLIIGEAAVERLHQRRSSRTTGRTSRRSTAGCARLGPAHLHAGGDPRGRSRRPRSTPTSRTIPDAALSAARRLGASFILRGLISSEAMPSIDHPRSTRSTVNMGFTLTGSNGRIISDVDASSSSYAGADVAQMALTLVNEQADEVVAKLYGDYCRNAAPAGVAKSASRNEAPNAVRDTHRTLWRNGMSNLTSMHAVPPDPRPSRSLACASLAHRAAHVRQSVADRGQQDVADRPTQPPTRRSTSRSMYTNATRRARRWSCIPGEIKSNNATFLQKFTANNIADFGEIELSNANFQVLERSNLGPLLNEFELAYNLGDPQAARKFLGMGKLKSDQVRREVRHPEDRAGRRRRSRDSTAARSGRWPGSSARSAARAAAAQAGHGRRHGTRLGADERGDRRVDHRHALQDHQRRDHRAARAGLHRGEDGSRRDVDVGARRLAVAAGRRRRSTRWCSGWSRSPSGKSTTSTSDATHRRADRDAGPPPALPFSARDPAGAAQLPGSNEWRK